MRFGRYGLNDMLSKYNFFTEINNGTLVYNSLTGAIIFLEKDTYLKLITDKFNELPYDYQLTLRKNGIVVNFDELEYIQTARNHLIEKNDRFNLTILTTTNCNARCYYCYEYGIKHSDMSMSTADKIITFVKYNIQSRKLHITWFGGEPLINREIITYISAALKKEQLDFSASIITNGLLVKELQQNDFKVWNLTKAQITLDGIFENYNDIKNYIEYKDSAFDHVINNIEKMISWGIYVSIRLNFNPSEYSNTLTTIDYLYGKFGNNKYLRIYVSNINDSNVILPNDQEPRKNAFIELYKKLLDCGYINNLYDLQLKQKMIYCGNIRDNFVVIDPEGILYKCEHSVNCHSEAFGTIFDNNYNNENLAKWKNTLYPYDECFQCKCLPICQGGCKALVFYNGRKSNCIQIKEVIPDIVKLYYLHLANKNPK